MEGDSVKHKKKALAMLLALVLLIAAVGGTLALFTREARATNVITTGTVDLELTEKRLVNNREESYPVEPITNVMPGTSQSKIPYIKNAGTADLYTRVKIAVTIINDDGEALPTLLPDQRTPVVTYDIITDDWIDGGDGFYYYKAAIAPGADPVKLFNQVTFAPAMGNEYQGCTVTVSIQAQAVQAKNNEIPVGGSILDVNGWPADPAE